MRSLKKNTQKMKYSVYSDNTVVYLRDENNQIVYVQVDGVNVPVEDYRVSRYSQPVQFEANISFDGNASMREYGVSETDYDAVIVTTDKSLGIDEKTVIWTCSEVERHNDGYVNGDSADWKVVSIKPSINSTKYLLKKIQKDGE